MAPMVAEHRRSVTLGGTLVHIADRQPVFWDKVAAGRWEPHTLSAIEEAISPDITFIDVGAWVGATTLLAAACGARVLALEPDPAAHEQLLANLAANPTLAGRIAVLPQALAGAPGSVDMAARRKPGDSMSSTVFAGEAERWSAETVTVADLVAEIPGGSALVVKIDIEGAEYDLAGHLAAFAAGRPCLVLLSLHPSLYRSVRGEAALAQACAAMAEAFRGFKAERALRVGWHSEAAFVPEIYRSEPSEWRLCNPAWAAQAALADGGSAARSLRCNS